MMRTTVQIEDSWGLKLPVKRKISKIVSLLFEIDDIKKRSCINGLDVQRLAFSIVFTDDKTIHAINKNYRKKDRPTDVITFALFADDTHKFVFNKTAELGEIIISAETAKKQAKDGFEKEILTLICHGILHLLGFDHLSEADYNFVVGIQDSIISKL